MLKIRKKILTDEADRPVAVQIHYSDWLEIERSLNLRGDHSRATDLSRHDGFQRLVSARTPGNTGISENRTP